MQLENTANHRSSKRFGGRFRRSRVLGVGAVAGWISVIAVLLGSADPSIPGDGVAAGGEVWFVLGHLFLFAVLGLLTVLAALMGGWTGRLTAAQTVGLVLGSVVGVLTEVYQLGVSGRSGNLEDVATDVAGAAGGAVLACLVYARIFKQRNVNLENSYLER